MNYKPWLFLVFLAIASDMLASGVMGFVLWKYRNGVTGRLAVLFFGIFLCGLGSLVANAFGYTREPTFSLGFAWSYWIGRACQSLSIWFFVLKFLADTKKREMG